MTLFSIFDSRVDRADFIWYLLISMLFSFVICEICYTHCNEYADFLLYKHNKKNRKNYYKKHKKNISVENGYGCRLLLHPKTDRLYGKSEPKRKKYLLYVWASRAIKLGQIAYIIIGVLAVVYGYHTRLMDYRIQLCLCFKFCVGFAILPLIAFISLIPFGGLQEFNYNTPWRPYTEYWKE